MKPKNFFLGTFPNLIFNFLYIFIKLFVILIDFFNKTQNKYLTNGMCMLLKSHTYMQNNAINYKFSIFYLVFNGFNFIHRAFKHIIYEQIISLKTLLA